MRAALYWTPQPDDPLFRAGNTWLGRDPEANVSLPQPAIPGLPEATADARVYGFHATLRPPMRLCTCWQAYRRTIGALAQGLRPFPLPGLCVADFGGFLVLRETEPCQELHALADACVRATDPHRLPPSEAELARRRRGGLTAAEEALLARWGYPHVMDHWRFHMTLTRRLSAAEAARLRPAAEAHFAAAQSRPRSVSDLAVFTQHDTAGGDAPAPFLLAERIKLGAPAVTG